MCISLHLAASRCISLHLAASGCSPSIHTDSRHLRATVSSSSSVAVK